MGPAPREVVEISSSDDEEEAGYGRLILSPRALGRAAKNTGKPRGARAGDDGDSDSEEDDDCVVLDGDPDKPVAVAGAKGRSGGDGASDEVDIVAVKGEIACKDFPHSRHSCSELPFSTTSHTKHCSMCYCFVCDAPAPCKYWGKGLLDDDHCHATDKETKWKILRQAFKCKSVPYDIDSQDLALLFNDVGIGGLEVHPSNCQVLVGAIAGEEQREVGGLLPSPGGDDQQTFVDPLWLRDSLLASCLGSRQQLFLS